MSARLLLNLGGFLWRLLNGTEEHRLRSTGSYSTSIPRDAALPAESAAALSLPESRDRVNHNRTQQPQNSRCIVAGPCLPRGGPVHAAAAVSPGHSPAKGASRAP